MKYQIKERFWSFTDDFHIFDGSGNKVFAVHGAAFSWGDNLSFQDTTGHELARITQKLLSFRPCYEIHRGGQHFATVLKEFTWFNKKFTLDVPGPNDYEIEGSFWMHDYTFRRGGRVVAEVSKNWVGLTDSYGIGIVEGEDDVSILCTAIVIDQVLHDESSS